MSKPSKKHRAHQRLTNAPSARKIPRKKPRSPDNPTKPYERPKRRKNAVAVQPSGVATKPKTQPKASASSPRKRGTETTVDTLLNAAVSGQVVRLNDNDVEINGPFSISEDTGLCMIANGRSQTICPALWVLGEIVDADGTNPAYMVRFRNRLDREVFAEIPFTVAQEPNALFAQLTQKGLTDEIDSPKSRGDALRAYLIWNCPSDSVGIRLRENGLTTLPDGSERYCLDGEIYGREGNAQRYEAYAFNSASGVSPAHQSVPAAQAAKDAHKAALTAWHGVTKALRNDLLAVLVICAAFASVFLKHTQQSSKALFLIGLSSIGKTILLKLVNALFSRQTTLFTWDGTDNGIEANLAQHRDRSLVLDEMGQSSGKQVSGLAYRLMNGSGRQRADASGNAKAIATTRSIIVSSGELSPFDLMRQAHQTIHKGQEARLLVVPVQEPHGVWSVLATFASGAEKSAWVEAQLDAFRGVPGREFLTHVVSKLPALAEEFKAVSSRLAADIASEVEFDANDNVQGRVLQSFTLFAFAGIIAIRAGVVSWEEKHVVRAVRHGYGLWHAEYLKNQPINDEALLQPVRVFLQSERGSRIKPSDTWADEHGDTVAGYEHVHRNGERVFLIYPAYFQKHLCGKYPAKHVLTALRNADLLVAGSRDVPTKQVHMPGSENTRRSFYEVRKRIVEG